MKKSRVMIISTGGTIEKTYDEFDGSLENRATAIYERILPKLRLPYTEIAVKSIMAKDSLNLDDQDRRIIYDALKQFSEYGDPIVVLHGTDTMEVTAKYCFDQEHNFNVPIVFTGAMKPLGFEDSDALQNITEALYAAKLLNPGLYVSFHNQIFVVPNVTKNRKTRTFDRLSD